MERMILPPMCRALVTTFLVIASSISLLAEPPQARLCNPAGARCAFVATSTVVHNSYERGIGENRTVVDLYCHDRVNTRCQIRYFDIPKDAPKMSLLNVIKFGCPEDWAAPGILEKTGDVSLKGISGEEYTLKGLPYEGRIRVFVANGRAYILSTTIAHERIRNDSERESVSFLDSFEIIGK